MLTKTCAFNTGLGKASDVLKIKVKYSFMKMERVIYPDVYCFPLWLGYPYHFLRNGEDISGKNYDYIFSELNSGTRQLEYLLRVVQSYPDKTIIFPGPPEIFLSRADQKKLLLAREILTTAKHVWAYSENVAEFADHCAEANVAEIIPWPFNYHEIRRLGGINHKQRNYFNILIGAPLRFAGIACNAPDHLEESIADVLCQMDEEERNKFKFYAFVYTDEDKASWHKSRFGERIGVKLIPRMRYTKFLKFLTQCDAVIQLLSINALGRITYISAALGKPGIFTRNIGLSQYLYPNSLVSNPTDNNLRGRVELLLNGFLSGKIADCFWPDTVATQSMGDFNKNAGTLRSFLVQN